MAESSAIEWTDATFNPWQGCTKVSPGCDHCYAEARLDRRLHVVSWGPGQARKRTTPKNWKEPTQWNLRPYAECVSCGWRGEAKDCPNMGQSCPRCSGNVRSARRRVFCASLADVFDNEVPVSWRADLFRLIADTPNLDWLLLTKRIGNAKTMMADALHLVPAANRDGMIWALPNVWLGATIVNQLEADRDIPKLLATPARLRFLSMEPLLGPVEFSNVTRRSDAVKQLGKPALAGIDWVIAGGESGHGARPVHPDWIRSLRDQCAAVGVPFLFKQWGEFLPAHANEADPGVADVPDSRLFWSDGSKWDRYDGQRAGVDLVARIGKKAAGRLLDGREHNQFPSVTP